MWHEDFQVIHQVPASVGMIHDTHMILRNKNRHILHLRAIFSTTDTFTYERLLGCALKCTSFTCNHTH